MFNDHLATHTNCSLESQDFPGSNNFFIDNKAGLITSTTLSIHPDIDLRRTVEINTQSLGFKQGAKALELDTSDSVFGSQVLDRRSAVEQFSKEVFKAPSLEMTLEKALKITRDSFKRLTKDQDFTRKIQLVFGEEFNIREGKKLITNLALDNLNSLPQIKLLPTVSIGGANGAFDYLNNIIYLSNEYISQHTDNPRAIANVLIEEFGHYIDSQVNEFDTPGDEGAIFAEIAQDFTLTEPELLKLKTEDDIAIVEIVGQPTEIEKSDHTLTSKFNRQQSRRGDWYSSNLRDPGLIDLTRQFMADGKLDRLEMIEILRETDYWGRVTADELGDLRIIVGNLPMPESVRVLAHKVVYAEPANKRSGIGNLRSDSRGFQLWALIDKWFYGADLPDSAGIYQPVSGVRVKDGASYTDVDQGSVGNCYFLAALAATAYRAPNAIYSMITENWDSPTFTVRFFNKGEADYVTVNRALPTSPSGKFIYANDNSLLTHSDANNELWVALVEKAYAQMNESGWIGQDKTNSYEGISGGRSYKVLEQITGCKTKVGKISSKGIENMLNVFNQGQLVTLSTNKKTDSGIVGRHAYALLGFDPITQEFELYNPHGPHVSPIKVSREQILKNFKRYDYTLNASIWQGGLI